MSDNKTKDYFLFIIALIVMCLLMFKISDPFNLKIKKREGTTIDTVLIHKIDTIRDTITIHHYSSIPSKPIIINDTVLTNNIDLDSLNKIREYIDTIDDENITIYSKDIVQGYYLNKNVDYKLKVPIKIIDSVKMIITKNIDKTPKNSLYVGLDVSKGVISPNINYSYKKHMFGVGYNVLSKLPIVSYKYRLISK